VDQDPRAIVGRYWEGLWQQHDLGVVDEIFSDAYVRHSSAGTKSLSRAALKRELKDAWQLLHRPSTTIDDQAVDGDKVWTRATTQGVNVESGETSVITWLIVQRVADGRLVEAWSATLPDVDWR
jgi:prophage tail gpP-like protein